MENEEQEEFLPLFETSHSTFGHSFLPQAIRQYSEEVCIHYVKVSVKYITENPGH